MINRNIRVYTERIRVLSSIDRDAKAAIENGEEWESKYDLLHRYSYNQMLLHVWYPVKWFYKDIK